MMENYSGTTDTSAINSEVLEQLVQRVQHNSEADDYKECVKILCDFAKN